MLLPQRMAEELVLVAGAGAAALDLEALPRRHEGGVALLLVAAEEGGDRHMQRRRQRLQRVERRRGHAVLDLRQHAGGELGLPGELGHGHVELLAELADLAADGRFRAGRWRGSRRLVRVLELRLRLGASAFGRRRRRAPRAPSVRFAVAFLTRRPPIASGPRARRARRRTPPSRRSGSPKDIRRRRCRPEDE